MGDTFAGGKPGAGRAVSFRQFALFSSLFLGQVYENAAPCWPCEPPDAFLPAKGLGNPAGFLYTDILKGKPSHPPAPQGMGPIQKGYAGMRLIYLVIAFFFLGLGAVGAALPVLPTVPFLLISGFCFSRSSRRLDEWFRRTRLYKRHLSAFMEHRSMLLRTKVIIRAFT